MSDCVRCGVRVTDETLRHVHYDEDYPDIDIGPYCLDCVSLVRICSGCHTPHIEGEDIKYFGDCLHYCDSCAEDIETCDVCTRVKSIHAEYEGKKMCESCFLANYRTCNCCNQIKSKNIFVMDGLTRARRPALFEEFKDICEPCYSRIHPEYEEVRVKECKNCRGLYGETATTHPRFCPDCMLFLPKCVDCGEACKDMNARTVVNEQGTLDHAHVCSSCLVKYKECSGCGGWAKEYKTHQGKLGGTVLCSTCGHRGVSECPDCLSFKTLNADTGKCHDCNVTYELNHCTNCGQAKDHHMNCRGCGSARRHIYNYTFKPQLKFHYTKKDQRRQDFLFMGIENEVTFRDSTEANQQLSRIYKHHDPRILTCKADASIHGSGYEIVTQPMTLDFFNKMDITKLFSDTLRMSESCGMHVHVGRNAFLNDTHIFKVTNFIHNNNEYVDMISGRAYNSYSGPFSQKISSVVLTAKKHKQAARHVRVNLRNKSTIEFRMFAGCITEATMRYRVEFIHALITWSQNVPISNTSAGDFQRYVLDNKKLYPILHKFITKHGG